MSLQDSVRVFIYFHLPFANHSGSLETQVKTTDSSEQRAEREGQ
jgi:hypothetical protein